MKKSLIKACVAAVAAAFVGNAFATVDLQTGAGAVAFARELTYSSTAPGAPLVGTVVAGAGGQLEVTGTLGFGVSAGATRYIRITLANATFAGAAGAVSVACAAAVAGTIVQGGSAGLDYVIYQFTAPAGDCTAAAVVTVQESAAGLNVTNNGSPVTVQYRLHETAVDAVNNTNALFAAGPRNLATFSAGLKYAITPATVIANVTDGFKKFCASATTCAPTVVTKSLGVVDYGVNAVFKRDGTLIALADLVTAATSIVVTGDLVASPAAGSVFLGTDAVGTCGVGVAGVLNTAETTSTITVGTTAYNRDICWTVDGTTVIPSMIVNQALDLTAVAGTTSADTVAALLGTVTRNGASTVALNVTDPANIDQTFIRISNMGGTTGRITGTLYGQDGTQLGAADVVLVAAAGPRSTTIFNSSALATAFGVTGWVGRAKLVVIGEFPSGTLRVQLLQRTGGVLVNVGGDTSTNGN